MRDSFVEVLVERKVSIGIILGYYISIILTAISVFLYFFGIGFPAIILVILFGFLTYFIGLRRKLEYEYSYFDKELDVDVIYSMKKRKRVKSFDLEKMEILAPANSHHLDEYKNRKVTVYDYSSKKAEMAPGIYVIYMDGNEKIILEPSEKMIDAIYHFAPRKVFRD